MAPLAADIEYVTKVAPAHGMVLPVIGPGVTGTFVIGVMAITVAALTPQPLAAVTVTLPPVPFGVTVIDVVP